MGVFKSSLCHLSTSPMGSRCSKPTREATPQEQSPPIILRGVEAPGSSSRRSGTRPGLPTPNIGGALSPERHTHDSDSVHSTPRRVQYMDGGNNVTPFDRRSGARTSITSSGRGPTPNHGQMSAGASRRRLTASYPARQPLNPTVRQVLPEHFKFRILVLGKNCSGKSSLIKAVFKVGATCDVNKAEPKDTRGNANINVEFHPDDNRYLIVHEYSGLGSQAGDSRNLQIIRDFILHRTDVNRSPSERLHTVWICVSASDVIAGRLGEGVEEILGMRTVPVILVITKFDVGVRGDAQQHEHTRARAFAMCEDSCRRLFNKDLRDVPAEIVSEKPGYADLIEKLVVTTDRFIIGARSPLVGFGVQGDKPRVSAVPLAWSAALRVSPDIVVQASIEVGRSGYWRRLWSSVDFADHSLKSCVNTIHADLVETWNLNDKTRYLSSDEFKAKMSHLVKDLVGSADTSIFSATTLVHDAYRGSQENVRCVMGYIVDLTVILDAIFNTTPDDISPDYVQMVIDRHVHSGHRNRIHRDIRSFVTEASAVRFSVPHKDLILEKIIDLIQEFCVPTRSG
ncbi:hypothetical protein EDB86DRAFT_3246299 [Lactarius hatsudake]|nr:hypothetical protein EDB86DRAFT_3246299 [Lactarius hatsudake]